MAKATPKGTPPNVFAKLTTTGRVPGATRRNRTRQQLQRAQWRPHQPTGSSVTWKDIETGGQAWIEIVDGEEMLVFAGADGVAVGYMPTRLVPGFLEIARMPDGGWREE